MDLTRLLQIKEKMLKLKSRREELKIVLDNADTELISINNSIHELETEAHSMTTGYIHNDK